MTDPIEFQRRPRGWGEMFDAPPLGNTARFRGDAAAVFGDDDKEEFRYALARCWDHNLPLWLWVMLNPSTATESENDRTVNRCLDFTWRLSRQKAGGLVIVNLFAHRATEWRELSPCPQSRRIGERRMDSTDFAIRSNIQNHSGLGKSRSEKFLRFSSQGCFAPFA